MSALSCAPSWMSAQEATPTSSATHAQRVNMAAHAIQQQLVRSLSQQHAMSFRFEGDMKLRWGLPLMRHLPRSDSTRGVCA